MTATCSRKRNGSVLIKYLMHVCSIIFTGCNCMVPSATSGINGSSPLENVNSLQHNINNGYCALQTAKMICCARDSFCSQLNHTSNMSDVLSVSIQPIVKFTKLNSENSHAVIGMSLELFFRNEILRECDEPGKRSHRPNIRLLNFADKAVIKTRRPLLQNWTHTAQQVLYELDFGIIETKCASRDAGDFPFDTIHCFLALEVMNCSDVDVLVKPVFDSIKNADSENESFRYIGVASRQAIGDWMIPKALGWRSGFHNFTLRQRNEEALIAVKWNQVDATKLGSRIVVMSINFVRSNKYIFQFFGIPAMIVAISWTGFLLNLRYALYINAMCLLPMLAYAVTLLMQFDDLGLTTIPTRFIFGCVGFIFVQAVAIILGVKFLRCHRTLYFRKLDYATELQLLLRSSEAADSNSSDDKTPSNDLSNGTFHQAIDRSRLRSLLESTRSDVLTPLGFVDHTRNFLDIDAARKQHVYARRLRFGALIVFAFAYLVFTIALFSGKDLGRSRQSWAAQTSGEEDSQLSFLDGLIDGFDSR